MSDLVGNPEDRFSHNESHLLKGITSCKPLGKEWSEVSQQGFSLLRSISGHIIIESMQGRGGLQRSNCRCGQFQAGSGYNRFIPYEGRSIIS